MEHSGVVYLEDGWSGALLPEKMDHFIATKDGEAVKEGGACKKEGQRK